MYPYINLLRTTLAEGVRQKNRTGVDTFMIPGGMMQFTFNDGFPILTTKKVNFDAIKAELVGFIRGVSSAADFRRLGTKIWDANANDNKTWLSSPHRKGPDDLGPIYGVQWRNWPTPSDHKDMFIDQFHEAVKKIIETPQDRRIIVTAWNPGEIHKMALPPCHLLYQFLVGQVEKQLHMTMYMRSCDMFLGVPFNISSYALLLELVAMATGYTPGKLTMFLADCHVYINHVDQVKEQLNRWPFKLPKLVVSGTAKSILQGEITVGRAMYFLENIQPVEISLEGYDPHPAIKADMAV